MDWSRKYADLAYSYCRNFKKYNVILSEHNLCLYSSKKDSTIMCACKQVHIRVSVVS